MALCSVCKNPLARAAIDGMLDKGTTGADISRTLAEWGARFSPDVVNRHKRHWRKVEPVVNAGSPAWLAVKAFPCVVGHGAALERHLRGEATYVHAVYLHNEAEWKHYRLSRLVLAGMADEVLETWPEGVLSRGERRALADIRTRMTAFLADARERVSAEVEWYESGFARFRELFEAVQS